MTEQTNRSMEIWREVQTVGRKCVTIKQNVEAQTERDVDGNTDTKMYATVGMQENECMHEKIDKCTN